MAKKLKTLIEDLERQIIVEGIKRTRWDIPRLAKELRIPTKNLRTRIKRLNINTVDYSTMNTDLLGQ